MTNTICGNPSENEEKLQNIKTDQNALEEGKENHGGIITVSDALAKSFRSQKQIERHTLAANSDSSFNSIEAILEDDGLSKNFLLTKQQHDREKKNLQEIQQDGLRSTVKYYPGYEKILSKNISGNYNVKNFEHITDDDKKELVYETTSSQFGKNEVLEHHLPTRYCPVNHKFTQNMGKFKPARSSGIKMNTKVTTHNVLPAKCCDTGNI